MERILATETPIPFAPRVSSPLIALNLDALPVPGDKPKESAPSDNKPVGEPEWQRLLKKLLDLRLLVVLVVLYLIFKT